MKGAEGYMSTLIMYAFSGSLPAKAQELGKEHAA